MAQRRKLSHYQKVRELVSVLGSRKAVVKFMDAASKSSLKRWTRRDCEPLRAHILLVNQAHNMVRKMKVIERNLRRDVEVKVRMEMLAQSAKRNRRK